VTFRQRNAFHHGHQNSGAATKLHAELFGYQRPHTSLKLFLQLTEKQQIVRFAHVASTENNGSQHPSEDEKELIASIMPYVMRCLAQSGYFEDLDNRLCPSDDAIASESCHGDYRISLQILRAHGFSDMDTADIFSVLQAQGGFCDCEVLYNVAETSRLKSNYWRAVAEGRNPKAFHRRNT
jgi:hypothetical protein